MKYGHHSRQITLFTVEILLMVIFTLKNGKYGKCMCFIVGRVDGVGFAQMVAIFYIEHL